MLAERCGFSAEREPEPSSAAASAAILDTCTTTGHCRMSGRKRARLYSRWTELELFAPELLRSACFVTLTVKGNRTASEVHKGWDRVRHWLKRHGYCYYLTTSATQEKRLAKFGDDVLHYHIIVLGHRRVPASELRAIWGLGATFHKSARNPTHTVRYIAGYQGVQGGRLSWSGDLLRLLPAGARPHHNCFRYVRADPVSGYQGGIINFGWGGLVAVAESYSYVPALGRVMPNLATSYHSQLWTAYRLLIDWLSVREKIASDCRDESEFLGKLRGELAYSPSASPFARSGGQALAASERSTS
jgi:hypothetical protein